MTFITATTVTTPSGTVVGQHTETGDAIIEIKDVSFSASTTDKNIIFAVVLAKLKSLVMLSDVAATIETNATNHASGDELTLLAGVPWVWNNSGDKSSALAFDITTLYLTASLAGTFNLRCLYDSTP